MNTAELTANLFNLLVTFTYAAIAMGCFHIATYFYRHKENCFRKSICLLLSSFSFEYACRAVIWNLEANMHPWVRVCAMIPTFVALICLQRHLEKMRRRGSRALAEQPTEQQ